MTEARIQKIIDGDEVAFKQLVDNFQPQILSVCYSFIKEKESAKDVAQEVFIELCRSIKNFRNESALSTWIYRIAISKCIDHSRKQKSKKRFGLIREWIGIDMKEVRVLPAKESTPDKRIEENERMDILYSALKKIPESQRIAITLNKIDELNHTQIAKIMGVSVSAVESLVQRGKVNLRKKLNRYFERNI